MKLTVWWTRHEDLLPFLFVDGNRGVVVYLLAASMDRFSKSRVDGNSLEVIKFKLFYVPFSIIVLTYNYLHHLLLVCFVLLCNSQRCK